MFVFLMTGAEMTSKPLPPPSEADRLMLSTNDKLLIVKEALRLVQKDIHEQEVPFCYNGHSGTKQVYASKKWKLLMSKYGGGETLVYPFCLMTKELGNKLGNYFNELACAEVSGLNFLSTHKQWDLTGSHTANTTSHNSQLPIDLHKRAFLNALPDIVAHPSPVPEEVAVKRMNSLCKCTRYCWGDARAPWVNNTASIKKYLRVAVAAYLSTIDESEGTLISPDTDISNVQPGTFLPIVPEVALQYRCGDNIGFSCK